MVVIYDELVIRAAHEASPALAGFQRLVFFQRKPEFLQPQSKPIIRRACSLTLAFLREYFFAVCQMIRTRAG